MFLQGSRRKTSDLSLSSKTSSDPLDEDEAFKPDPDADDSTIFQTLKRKISNLGLFSGKTPSTDLLTEDEAFESDPDTANGQSEAPPCAESLLQSEFPPERKPSKGILAFRTMTTLIYNLRNAREMNLTIAEDQDLTQLERQELRVLVALATLLVRDHEVVSLAVLADEIKSHNVEGEHQIEEEHQVVKPIACAIFNNGYEEDKWRVRATQNSRRSSTKSVGSPEDGPQDGPTKDSDIGSAGTADSRGLLRSLYVNKDAYVQFKSFRLKLFSCLI